MPFTVAHAAAAVPLARALGRRAVLSALVIGSMVPDFWYFLPLHLKRADTHTLGGLFWFCLPVGLATYILYHTLLKQPWLELVPQPLALRLAACSPGGLPRARWSVVVTSVALGAASHLLWDALTHDGPFVERALPALDAALFSIGPYEAYGYSLLQHLSTAAGLTLLAMWLAAWYRSATPLAPAQRRLPRIAAVTLLVAVGAATAWIGADAALAVWKQHLTLPEARLLAKLAFGEAATAALAALLAYGVAWHLLGKIHRPS
jgi:hypothetical protein